MDIKCCASLFEMSPGRQAASVFSKNRNIGRHPDGGSDNWTAAAENFAHSAGDVVFKVQLTAVFVWVIVLKNIGRVSLNETVSLPVLFAAKIRRHEYQTCRYTALSGYLFHALLEWSFGNSFMVPRKSHVRSV